VDLAIDLHRFELSGVPGAAFFGPLEGLFAFHLLEPEVGIFGFVGGGKATTEDGEHECGDQKLAH